MVSAGGCWASQRFWVWWKRSTLGLGMVRGAVLLLDAQGGEEVLEGVLAAAVPGGVDASVVGQRGGRGAMEVAGLEDGLHDDVAGHGGVGGAADEVAGVVVEPVEDLDIGAVGQPPVGEVGLPALVGLGGFELSVGGAGSFPRFGDDQAGLVEDPADCGGRAAYSLVRSGARRW